MSFTGFAVNTRNLSPVTQPFRPIRLLYEARNKSHTHSLASPLLCLYVYVCVPIPFNAHVGLLFCSLETLFARSHTLNATQIANVFASFAIFLA